MDYSVAKGQMRKAQTDEIKALGKELKKKKGLQRDAVEKKIEETEARHISDLKGLAAQHGIEIPVPSAKSGTNQVPGKAEPKKKFPDLNWSNMSKKQLEEECVLRGVSKNGSKEDILTRLVIFTQSEETRLRDEKFAAAGTTGKTTMGGETKKSSAQDKKRRHTKKEASPNSLDESKSDNGDDETEESSSDSEAVEPAHKANYCSGRGGEVMRGSGGGGRGGKVPYNIPIPEVERGSDKRNHRGRGRKFNKRGRGKGGIASRAGGWNDESSDDGKNKKQNMTSETRKSQNVSSSSDSSPGSSTPSDAENGDKTKEDLRRKKRQRVMQGVLKEVVKRNSRGLDVDDLADELQKLKISNFRPALLGYQTTEEWLASVPSNILFFDASKGRLMPPREMPSSDDEMPSSDDEMPSSDEKD